MRRNGNEEEEEEADAHVTLFVELRMCWLVKRRADRPSTGSNDKLQEGLWFDL
jgi:hypothetical protein